MIRIRRAAARCLLSTSLSAVVLCAGAPAGSGAGIAPDGDRTILVPAGLEVAATYVAPVPEPLDVVRPFDPPADPYGPGHRGVDLAVGAGQLVRAPADGVVTFAGPVAGRGVVVVAHDDGISTEYEPLAPVTHAGDTVRQGDPLGHLAGTDAGCGRSGCLHWGARRAGIYLDPLVLLRPLGPVRLLPWSGRLAGRETGGDRD